MLRTTATLILFLAMFSALTACPGGKGGWSQRDKDTMIGSCVKGAKASMPAFEESKLKIYCSCYQQNIEKSFPNIKNIKDLKKNDAPMEVAKAGEACIELMFK